TVSVASAYAAEPSGHTGRLRIGWSSDARGIASCESPRSKACFGYAFPQPSGRSSRTVRSVGRAVRRVISPECRSFSPRVGVLEKLSDFMCSFVLDLLAGREALGELATLSIAVLDERDEVAKLDSAVASDAVEGDGAVVEELVQVGAAHP